jgi:hypothetical protein
VLSLSFGWYLNIVFTKAAACSIFVTGRAVGRALDARSFPNLSPYFIVLFDKPSAFANSVVWRQG